MHALRGRADERLTFDLQTRIATALSFPGATAQEKAERFMVRYFQYARDVGTLTRIFCAVLEEENLRIPHAPFAQEALARTIRPEFMMDGGRLQFAPHVTLHDQPTLAVELFYEAQQHGWIFTRGRSWPLQGRKANWHGNCPSKVCQPDVACNASVAQSARCHLAPHE